MPVRGDDYHDQAQAELNLRLVDRLIAARPKRVVFISSMTVYGEPCAGPVAEESATPHSAYARGKLEGERRLQASGVDWVAARLPGLFGGRRAGGLVYNLARCALEGREPTLPPEPLVWAAMHVEDAGEAVARLALAEGAHGPVNLGYDGALSVNRLLDALAAATGRRLATPIRHPDFEMRLDRARACGACCPISFEQRLAALVASLRAETVAGETAAGETAAGGTT